VDFAAATINYSKQLKQSIK